MSTDPNNVHQSDSENHQIPDVTVDLDAQTTRNRSSEESTSQNSSSGQDVTSIEISDFDQTMDLTPSNPSSDAMTMDLDQANDQTMDLDSQPRKAIDGTMMISPSMPPFQGKVFGNGNFEDGNGAGDQTRILAPHPDGADQTMDLSQYPSGSGSDGVGSAPSGTLDATMLLSDSQGGSHAGSQPGSSSIAGKSSYDQTMDLNDSASESKGVSDARSVSSPNKTGQSVPATGKSGFKSLADSRQYLQADRAKASDAFLDRVTERRISYTLDWNDVTADYQVNKKIDSKTGKLDLHVLGKGGMGLVYLATQNSVNRPVALKVIRKDKQTDAFSKQFFYEAEITAMLEHPNITPIYELGRTPEGTFFYSMKYIQGTPWEKKIRENSIEENLEIFDKLCDAIGFAHSKNIIHMDIKPDNVQLGGYGEVYAVDWGVASNLTRPESIRCAGTWQWISPEVSRGERDKIGKGSDIYLLGGVLFLIVTGHHPRLPKDPAIKMGQSGLTKAAQGNIIQPTDCKDPMVDVALKALSTDPRDRFARVEDLQDAIHAIQKQRANIKSSQELTVRSVDVGAQAQELGDYDRFNRSLFGLRDAIELWHQNPEAPGELKKVRLAYGQCAFDKGDYDLALQTLDRSEIIEDELYRKAEEAQTAVKLRAQRFRLLRNAFIALLAIGSGIVGWFGYQAEQARKKEEGAKKEALTAKNQAIESAEKAIAAETKALKAKEKETEARERAENSEQVAINAQQEERKAKDAAIIAKAKAEEQLAKTQLTEIASRLGLARSRLVEANPTGADQMLTDIRKALDTESKSMPLGRGSTTSQDPNTPASKLLITDLPSRSNWAQRRLELLANSKLSGTRLSELAGFESGPPALAIDLRDDSLIAAYPNGLIYKESFDGTEPTLLWEKNQSVGPLQWPDDVSIRRVVPSKDTNRLYVALIGSETPIVTINLDTNELTKFDQDIKKVGQRLALSPVSRHIATTQPGYIWFTKNEPNSNGNGVPTKDQTIQMKWLTDDLLLALIENNGTYHLSLIAPFIDSYEALDDDGTKKTRPAYVQYTATLDEDFVQFGLIDSVLPENITKFDPKLLGTLEENRSGEFKSDRVAQVFSEMIAALHFVVGQSDGNLVQTQLVKSNEKSALGMDIWIRTNQYTLPQTHLHTIEEIVVEDNIVPGFDRRRVLTRADKEQAVQVWNLDQTGADNQGDSGYELSHLHTLTGGTFKDEKSENKQILFSSLRKDGKVILVNSEWMAYLLDVQEQIDRKRVALEVPFQAAAFLESTAKWLFKHGSEGQVLSVDGYGGVALYDSNKQVSPATGKRLALGPQQSKMRLRSWPESSEMELDRAEKGVRDLKNFQYWGHSPFSQVQHFVVSPDGSRAMSLANIPGAYSGYLIPRGKNARAQSLEYKEICLWDLDNSQMIDRIIFESNDSIDRLSVLDQQRFVLGSVKTFSFIDLDPSVQSMVQSDMKDTAVQFCVPNPQYPFHAFFRADNDVAGTCWIGRISTDQSQPQISTNQITRKWFSPDDNCMTLNEGTSTLAPKGAPLAGCWSDDGLRLYVLDKSYQVHRFQLDPQSGTLSKTYGSGSFDLLKPDTQASDIIQGLAKRPERITMGMAASSSSPQGWSDTIYFDSIDLPEATRIAQARFASDSEPQWMIDTKASENQKFFRNRISKFLELNSTNITPSTKGRKIQDRHQPLHATSDASGKLLLLQYPSAVLFLSIEDPERASWFRLDRALGDLKSFDLSPDKSTLAVVDSNGLQLLRVVSTEDNRSYNLVPDLNLFPDAQSVIHFEWDKDSVTAEKAGVLQFAYILKDGTVGYFDAGTNNVLGRLSEIKPRVIASLDETKHHELNVSEIRDLWFFKEVLVNETDPTKADKQLRYLAIQYVEPSTEAKKVRFIQFGSRDPVEPVDWIDLGIGRRFTKVVPNDQGGVVVTGDNQGNVAVYLVSPYWGIANLVFDATSEADSPIECLSFIDENQEQDNMLIISNGNNHLIGLKTESLKRNRN